MWGCASLWLQRNSTWGGNPELASSLTGRSAYRADQGQRQRRKNTAWLHNRTFTGQTGAHAVPGEQLSPWWLYAPRQSPATRWRTPLWRSFSAAPSAPERRWWSHLEKIKKKTTGRDGLLHYRYKGFTFELEQQKQLFVTATCSGAVLHSE